MPRLPMPKKGEIWECDGRRVRVVLVQREQVHMENISSGRRTRRIRASFVRTFVRVAGANTVWRVRLPNRSSPVMPPPRTGPLAPVRPLKPISPRRLPGGVVH